MEDYLKMLEGAEDMYISDCARPVTLPEGNVVSFECFAQRAPMTPAALSLVVGMNLKSARYLPKRYISA